MSIATALNESICGFMCEECRHQHEEDREKEGILIQKSGRPEGVVSGHELFTMIDVIPKKVKIGTSID